MTFLIPSLRTLNSILTIDERLQIRDGSKHGKYKVLGVDLIRKQLHL